MVVAHGRPEPLPNGQTKARPKMGGLRPKTWTIYFVCGARASARVWLLEASSRSAGQAQDLQRRLPRKGPSLERPCSPTRTSTQKFGPSRHRESSMVPRVQKFTHTHTHTLSDRWGGSGIGKDRVAKRETTMVNTGSFLDRILFDDFSWRPHLLTNNEPTGLDRSRNAPSQVDVIRSSE